MKFLLLKNGWLIVTNPLKRGIMSMDSLFCRMTNRRLDFRRAKVNSTRQRRFLWWIYCLRVGYLRSTGFNRIWSGETRCNPNDVSTFLFNNSLARSYGVTPFRLSLAVLFM